MRRLALGVLLFVVGAATVAALTAWPQRVEPVADAAAIVAPVRTSAEPPLVAAPPAVPAHAADLPPVTCVLETAWSGPGARKVSTETLTRTRDRVRLALDGGQEWLFVRNAAYPDRVSGYLIDHPHRTIRLHEETALREALRIRGWADVLTLRFDPARLSSLRDTGERRDVGGAMATRFVAAESTGTGLMEVWWSEALLLPLSVTTREKDATVTARVTRVTYGADSSVLVDPDRRFPGYDSRDAVDVEDR